MNEGAGKTGVRTYKLLGSTDLKTLEEVADIKKVSKPFGRTPFIAAIE